MDAVSPIRAAQGLIQQANTVLARVCGPRYGWPWESCSNMVWSWKKQGMMDFYHPQILKQGMVGTMKSWLLSIDLDYNTSTVFIYRTWWEWLQHQQKQEYIPTYTNHKQGTSLNHCFVQRWGYKTNHHLVMSWVPWWECTGDIPWEYGIRYDGMRHENHVKILGLSEHGRSERLTV